MKKLLITLVCFACILTSQAQVSASFGAKAGANFYRFTGEDMDGDDSQKMKVGYEFGPFVNIAVSENFSIQPEVLYSNQGSMFKEGDAKLTYNLNYINIPVMLQYNTPSGFYVEGGPFIGFLTSAKMEFEDEEDDIKEALKGTNFGVGLGLGFRMSSGFGVGGRYNLGLSNISESSEGDLKNSGFSIGISYLFSSGN